MPREVRRYVRQGVYGVRLRTNLKVRLFPLEEDQREFEIILARTLVRMGAQLYAYSWLEDIAHLVIQIDEQPLGSIVQQVAAAYSRYINRRRGRRGHLFGRAYQSILLARTEYLPELVRHVHLTPVGAGLVADPADWPSSSHCAYLGQTVTPWLTTQVVFQLLEDRGWRGRCGYSQFIAQGERQQIAEVYGLDAIETLQVMGDDAFFRWLRDAQEERPSLEQIIQAVCVRLQIDPRELHMTSPRPVLPLARALVTWYATKGAGIALAAVGRRLHRHPATLYAGCKRQRAVRPSLFQEPIENLLQRKRRQLCEPANAPARTMRWVNND